MECKPEVLKHVPLFSLMDDDELAVLSAQVELRHFQPRQRIYKAGESTGLAYVIATGRVRVTTIDEDHQEVVVDEPSHGEFFGFASMLEQTPHQTTATAVDEVVCVEVSREDIAILLQRKPHTAMDMLSVLGRQFHSSQQLVRVRSTRNANEIIEEAATWPQHVADIMVKFGGSWTFIIGFAVAASVYTAINVLLGHTAWDPYPFILLNLILSLLAAIQAPVIMMSQNRQDAKDRLRNELDYNVNRRAEAEIQGLSRKLNLLGEQMGDLEDMLRNSTLRTPGTGGADSRAHA
jgi:CRP/FNR family transcriptional regulator, cyclic AMP receptor protein